MWLKDEGERSLLRELSSLWAKVFKGAEMGPFGGFSKSFGWVVVSILGVLCPGWLVLYIAVLMVSSSSSLSPVDPRCL